MYYIGNNKMPFSKCCVRSHGPARIQDRRMICICGPETWNIVGTFILINVPIVLSIITTTDLF